MNNLTKILRKSNFSILLRKNNKNLWDEVLKNIEYVPVLYTNESLDFEQEMLRVTSIDTNDISLIFSLQNKLICIWPISINILKNKKTLQSFTSPVLCPLFVNNTNKEIKRKIFLETLRIINELDDLSKEVEAYLPFLNTIKLNYWHTKSQKFAKYNSTEYEIFLRIDNSYEVISKNFRKGTKSSIKKAEKIWNVNILRHKDDLIWRNFKKVHFDASGRKTRSDKSWKIQYNNLINGRAFLVYLTNGTKKMVGGGFFTCSNDECEYSTGAYDRSLFDKPIGHLVQKAAIGEMINRNIKWYRIGLKALETNKSKPLDKDYSISLFKEGFSSNIFPVIKTKYFF